MPEKRLIRLGYVETDYPYVTECAVSPNWKACREPGINMVIWQELALRMNYEFVFVKSNYYGSFINGQWTGLVGALFNETVDASLALLTVSYERWNTSRFSVTLTESDFGFARGYFRENDQFQLHVFVFSPLVFFCIFISILLIGCIVSFRAKSVHGFWDAFSFAAQKDQKARHLKNPLIIFAFLVILLVYQAGTNSQRLSLKVSSGKTTLAAVRRDLLSGRSRLVLATPSVMGETLIDRLLQKTHADIHDVNPILELNEQRRIQLLCGNSNFITFGELRALLNSKFLPPGCSLQRVEFFDNIDSGGQMAFGFSKNFSSAHLRIINSIIGRIFTIEDIERTWLPQYHYNILQSTTLRKAGFSMLVSVTVQQLQYAYVFWAAGIVLSCIFFLLEKYSKPFCMSRNCSFIRI